MTEPRVESVVDGAVTVTDDPDGLAGALLAALLAESDDTRLRALVRGTQERLELAGLSIARYRSAIDLVHSGGPPIWIITGRGATTAVHGDLIERLFDQAYDQRRAAQMATFPIGGHLGHGRYTITERLRGTPDRGMYRARAGGAPTSYLVTLGPPQQRGFSDLRAQLALTVPGITPLDYIGRLEPHSEAGYEAMIEVEPEGVPAAALSLPIAPAIAAALTLQVARTVASAHAAGLAIGGLRPELVYVASVTAPVVTAIAPRAERFWVTAQRRSYGVPACFEQFFQAPELLAQPFDPPPASADVFSLAAMLAYWLTGEHPFDGDGASQAISIATGRRRPWRGPTGLAPIVHRALAPDPSARTPLDVLISQLEPLVRS